MPCNQVVILLVLLFFSINTKVFSVTEATITVTDVTHLYHGFGSNTGPWSVNRTTWDPWMSEDTKDILTNVLWADLNLTSCRFINSISEWNDDFRNERAKDLILRRLKFVHKGSPYIKKRYGMDDYDLKFLLTWANPYTNNHDEQLASAIKSMEDAIKDTARILLGDTSFDFKIQYTEYGNEPNQTHTGGAVPVPDDLNNVVFKDCRKALDDKGLKHCKLIGPGPSNCDNYMKNAIVSVTGDQEALNAAAGFSYHAYNMSITQEIYEMIPRDKEIWQTESSVPEGDVNWNMADSQAAVMTWVKFISDVNFGVNYWQYFMDAGPYDPITPGCFLIGLNPWTGDLVPYLKFFYLRALARTIVPGSTVYKCTTDMHLTHEYKDEYKLGGKDEFDPVLKYMQFTNHFKPPVSACAGTRPDGTWFLVAANETFLSKLPFYEATFVDKDDYNLTFHIPDLENAGLVEFKLWRVNNSQVKNNTWKELETVTMKDGRLTVLVHHCDIVCLTNGEFDTDFPDIPSNDDRISSVSTGGSCGNCGEGIVLSFFPPVAFRISSSIRRRKRLLKDRKA